MEHLTEATCLAIAEEVLDKVRTRFPLSSISVAAMEQQLEGLQFRFFSPGERLCYPFYNALTGDCIGQMQSREPSWLSHIFIQPPIQGQILRPVVCLCRYEDPDRIYPALVHELIHLFSSAWQWLSPQEVCLYSGVARFTYRCSDDGTAICCTGVQDVPLNERLTDYLAGQILGTSDAPTDPLSRQLAALSPEQIACAYFEHRGEDLSLFLAQHTANHY